MRARERLGAVASEDAAAQDVRSHDTTLYTAAIYDTAIYDAAGSSVGVETGIVTASPIWS